MIGGGVRVFRFGRRPAIASSAEALAERRAVLRDLSHAFPLGVWRVRGSCVLGSLGVVKVIVAVAAGYKLGCSHVTVYQAGTSSTWNVLAEVTPKSVRSVVSATRRALRKTAALAEVGSDAARLSGVQA